MLPIIRTVGASGQHFLVMNTIPLILDTDIGSDIDDAVALAYLLKQPRCEFLGITTVSGRPEKRASLADAICRKAGRADIPIHVGAANPLLAEQIQPQAPQFAALAGKHDHRHYSTENTAVAFLRDTIRSRPGEITLLTIGPLTNIALLFALAPDIPALLRGIVAMGGQFFPSGSEWNIRCDPHAAAMVLAAPVPVTLVGLDVTMKCVLPSDECRRRFPSIGGSLEIVSDMAEVWFKHTPACTFHDPLAAAIVFEPSLCGFTQGRAVVELSGPPPGGQSSWVDDTSDSQRAAATVDSGRFFEHYFGIVNC